MRLGLERKHRKKKHVFWRILEVSWIFQTDGSERQLYMGRVLWQAFHQIYFNEEKGNLSEMHEYLNHKAVDFELQKKGWKLPFQMRNVHAEPWNPDYLRKVEFILYRLWDNDFF